MAYDGPNPYPVNAGGTGTTSFGTGLVTASGTAAFNSINSATAGTIVQSQGTGMYPTFSTATYPATAGTSGNVLTSDGTNWLSQSASSSGAITTITGNSGGAQTPTTGNFNILGTGSITSVGTASTETIQLTGLTNHAILVGAGTATITKLALGTAGQVLQSGGASADPVYSTATYPSTAGTNGNILQSNGTNFTSVAFPTRVTTINGDSGSITGATVTIFANRTANATGRTVAFINSSATSTFTLTDASDNILLGRVAGNATLSGSSNLGIGAGALNALTSGAQNVALGQSSQTGMTSGVQNISIGYTSLTSNQTGNGSVAIGFECLNAYTGAGSCTAIGWRCLNNSVSGSFNIGLGIGAGNAYTGAETSNLVIANTGVVGESNVIRIGTTGTSSGQQNKCYIAGINGVTVTGTAVLCATDGQLGTIASSERYKENIVNMNDDVSIMALRPVEFNYKTDETKTKQYGLIAEEIDKAFPYLCFYNDEGKPESVKYHEIPVLLLKEIQRLNKRIEALEAR